MRYFSHTECQLPSGRRKLNILLKIPTPRSFRHTSRARLRTPSSDTRVRAAPSVATPPIGALAVAALGTPFAEGALTEYSYGAG
jgi:hypothetical protein